MDFSSFESELTASLLRFVTGKGFLDGTMLSSVTGDFAEKWEELAPAYVADAVKEFNQYPEFSLACALYAGMAIAVLWDADWEKYKTVEYSKLQGERGFDNMDDHIAAVFLGMGVGEGPAQKLSELASGCASTAMSAMRHALVERQTSDAFYLMVSAATCLYMAGASIQLRAMGYSMAKM